MNSLQFTTHAEGLGFPEGPVYMPDGSIAFVDLLHGVIRSWNEKNGLNVLAKVDGSPNGMCLGPDGRLWIANNGGIAPEAPGKLKVAERSLPHGAVQALDLKSGQLETMTTDGVTPHRPNDIVPTPEGGAAFTDPQNWECLRDKPETYLGGRVLHWRVDGETELLCELPGFPNGIIFHPDGSLLVNLTRHREIIRLPWIRGRIGTPELFCTFPESFAPDGMCLAGGFLLVAGSVGDMIAAVNLDGSPRGLVGTGHHTDPTNLCLADDRIFITMGFAHSLVSIQLDALLARF
ncbi:MULTISPECIES: SMP-30/gluconolactonase/LRE family protein [unclassified Brucella]|uniref:SMP-30/gluconolactonase/LRE family protein n=1 Tax=unclassified Brucella TaxID=2632610 RepID=UPI00217D8691|nr:MULTISPECIES: SMP-30/gluconolactonase/LRE family protein [unclassified Brucella]UWF67761.1 SMP-30/gluconolactonase/LRE family protein [Brucella sp. 1315]UWF70882.1 SMP-30/gluconolactonase/LRE family protein [Brucella sp. 2594]